MTTDGGGWTLIHKSNKANTLDRTNNGHNIAALASTQLDDVAVLPRAMIALLGDQFRIRSADNKTLYWRGIPYSAELDPNLMSDRCNVWVKSKLADTEILSWGHANWAGHALCLGLNILPNHIQHHHICIQRWCCGSPNAGFWFNGDNWQSGAYYAGTVWVRFQAPVYPASCDNKKQDPGETDLDCGGSCSPCADNHTCTQHSDCISDFCDNGRCKSRTGQNCSEIKQNYPNAPDGVYPIQVNKRTLPIYCDMTTDGGGWSLVFRATNRTRLTENGQLQEIGPFGELPLTLASVSRHKLTDQEINALRTGSVINDMRVIVRAPGFSGIQGKAFHRRECVFNSQTNYQIGHLCLQSTQIGPNDTQYQASGHYGLLSRWYVGSGSFGSGQIRYLILGANSGGIHISPVSNGERGDSSHPGGYCTYYDSRTCPMDSAIEVWVK
jgi:hypothetical protein